MKQIIGLVACFIGGAVVGNNGNLYAVVRMLIAQAGVFIIITSR